MNKKDIEEILPLHDSQVALLIPYILSNETKIGFEQQAYIISGIKDINTLKKAFDGLAQLYQSLRCTVHYVGLSRPVQVVHRQMDVSRIVDYIDIQRLLHDLWDEPMKLSARAFEAILCQMDSENLMVVLRYHHLLFDGWSNILILRELIRIYHSLTFDIPYQQPAVLGNRVYYSYIKNLSEMPYDGFWTRYLKNPPVPIFKSKQIDILKGFKQSDISYTLTFTEFNCLINAAIQCGITPAVFFCLVWALVLKELYTLNDVIFNVVFSGRDINLPLIETFIGPCITTAPLRVRNMNSYSALKLAQGIRDDLQYIQSNQYAKDAKRDIILSQSMVNIQNYPKNLDLPDQRYKIDLYQSKYANGFLLSLNVFTFNSQYTVQLSYDANFFNEDEALVIMKKIKEIVASLLQNLLN